MQLKTRHIAVVVGVILLVLSIPAILILLLSIPQCASYINNTLSLTNSDFLSSCLSYSSLLTSLILGIVVYFQAQKINELQATEHKTFLGISDVNYMSSSNSTLIIDPDIEDFSIAHMFNSDYKEILTCINVGDSQQAKTLLLPLEFITKNRALIVSIRFKLVRVQMYNKDRCIADKSFENKNKIIHTILDDGSKFTLKFGVVMPDTYDPDEICLSFVVETRDQNGFITEFRPNVTLNKTGTTNRFALSSSRSL